ncbi:alpha/beta hydrolase [Rhodovulum sulfidophilum]|uniref:Palmitoyl-protein thioesterase ABHD10, mitochondrial n=1 Tax=Rhodovulum visakhapatnamense TaxID=364297 RepID=A0ABS1RD63_9RHOB|nr:alpha/beta hydrolase [Rhodovulum visakhapatnamense]MBL3570743.1 alpha/beta hydrolase [Rhodovulum visakhapatnamense]MBL3576882.1 alpha/beta hydrolase [Rhodovulum visakhapatnamense]OLS43983.1 alpha/beta hydrolase [Rhodovulum sulfidophilum]
MTEPQMLTTPEGRRLAYHRTEGRAPGIVFLGGFMSDMEGTKATHLETWAKAQGRAFLRFDYSGHGQSSDRFDEGAIGDWAADARAALGALTEGPQVLVGSSMGGWIALLLARALPHRVAGLVGIAAAPDFTEDSMWAGFSDAQRAELMTAGRVEIPSAYADSPYVITRRLIEDGRRNLVLRAPLAFNVPVRLLQGTADEDVDLSVALRLLDRIEAPDLRLTLVKGADHRFSTPETLALIETAILEVA